jgi:hypothetical protein
MKKRKLKKGPNKYALQANWQSLPTEGDGGLRALRVTLGAHWVMNMQQGYEGTCEEIAELRLQVNAEMVARAQAAKAAS